MAEILQALFTGDVSPETVVSCIKNPHRVKNCLKVPGAEYQEFVPFLLNYLRDQTLHLLQFNRSANPSPAKTPSAQKLKKQNCGREDGGNKRIQLFGASPGDCLEEIDKIPASVFSSNVSFDSPGVGWKCHSTPSSVEKSNKSLHSRESTPKGHIQQNAQHGQQQSSPHASGQVHEGQRQRHRMSLGEFLVSPDPDSKPNSRKKHSPFSAGRKDRSCDNSPLTIGGKQCGSNKRRSAGAKNDLLLSPAPVFSLNSVNDFPPMESESSQRKPEHDGRCNMSPVIRMNDSPNFDMTPRHSKPTVITKSRRISFTTLSPADNTQTTGESSVAPSRRIKPTPVQGNIVRQQNKAFLDTIASDTSQDTGPPESNNLHSQVKSCLLQERELLRQERAKRLQSADSAFTSVPVTPTKLVLDRSNSVLEVADRGQVTWEEKLDVLAGIYSLCLQENLLPNLAVELYFLVQLLTARNMDLELISDYDLFETNYFCSIHNTVYFSVSVLEKQTSFLKLLDRSTLRLLSENQRILGFSEFLSNWLNSESIIAQSKIAPVLPNSPIGGVSFQAETDNRKNFPNDSSFHLFKKQRDLFYELLRDWESNHMNPAWSIMRCLGDRIRSLVNYRAELANHLHFARLFQSQLITMCKGDGSIHTEGEDENIALLSQLKRTNPEKFKRLQERFIMPLSVGGPCPTPSFPGCQEFFRDFITAANSPIFNQHLSDTFTANIMELNSLSILEEESEETESSGDSDDEEKQRFVSSLMTLRLLAKFLGYVTFLPYQSTSKFPEEMEAMYRLHRKNHCLPVDLRDSLRLGYCHGRLSLTVPWVVEFLSLMDDVAPKIDIIQFVLFILLFIHRLNWRKTGNNYKELLITTTISWLFENFVLPEGFFYMEIPIEVTTFMCASSDVVLQNLDDMAFIDQKLLYTCCPYMGEVKTLLVEFAVGSSSKNSTIRKITPISADDTAQRTLSQRQTQLQLEENYFHNHPASLKRTVDFVADRTASNYIKKFRATLLQSSIIDSKAALAQQLESMAGGSPSGKAKDKLLLVVVKLSKDFVLKVKAESAAEVESYCQKKTAAVLPLLLPDEQSEAVINMSSHISLRVAVDKVQQWMNKHITSGMFQGELQLELDRLLKVVMLTERQAGGVTQKTLNQDANTEVIAKQHDFSVLSPSDALVELKQMVRDFDHIQHQPQSYKNMLNLIKDVLLRRQDVTPSVYRSYGQLSLDLCLGIISKTPCHEDFDCFVELWNSGLKPFTPFHSILCSRVVLQLKSSTTPQASWQTYCSWMKRLLNENFITIKDLLPNFILVLDTMEDCAEQLGTILLTITDKMTEDIDLGEALSLVIQKVKPSCALAKQTQNRLDTIKAAQERHTESQQVTEASTCVKEESECLGTVKDSDNEKVAKTNVPSLCDVEIKENCCPTVVVRTAVKTRDYCNNLNCDIQQLQTSFQGLSTQNVCNVKRNIED